MNLAATFSLEVFSNLKAARAWMRS